MSNGSLLYGLESTKPGLCFFELVFRNGRWTEHKKLSARLAANLIMEGSEQYTAEQVADKIDFYGAHFSVHADLDFTTVSLSCLQKHFMELLNFISELILNPAYRETDLQKAKVFLKSQLQHQLSEPDYVSYREFTSLIYGADTVYGYNTTLERIEAIQSEDLKRYQSENYCSDFLTAFYCGSNDAVYQNCIKEILEKFPKTLKEIETTHFLPQAQQQKLHIPISHSSQTSLKIGIRTFARQHPDFFGLYLLNTVLGDYFGSRLMKNIREDKGFTYDIHSNLDAQKHDGCFYISAELNPEQLEASIALIKSELNELRRHLIPQSELEMVRNYLCGNMLRLMDGPFQTIVFLKILISEYGTADAFNLLKSEILTTNSEKLRELAEKYLDPDKMILVTAGA
ncbi:MAG: insulinase family protein [Saprospiraceae bacterium]|nr:insulinase family protein [Saprospiraceae bacterium]